MAGLGALLFAPPLRAAPTVTRDQADCFQVQFLLRLNGLESQRFVGQVASLRDMDPADPATAARVGDLSRESVTLRRDEAQTFARVGGLLRTMGAPAELRAWAEGEADGLLRPVLMSADERKTAATQPDVASVLATLDECDRVETDTDDHIATLGTWLSLTRHAAALWAADVGELAATLRVGISDGIPPRLSATLGRHLAATAPSGTPAAVQDALRLLSPQAGNLSDLAPQTTTDVPLATAAQAEDALISAFSARPLVTTPPPVSP